MVSSGRGAGEQASTEMLYDAFANNLSLKNLHLPLDLLAESLLSGFFRAIPMMASLESLDIGGVVANNKEASATLRIVRRCQKLSSFLLRYDDSILLQINKIGPEDFVQSAPCLYGRLRWQS